jgi:MFS family permease
MEEVIIKLLLLALVAIPFVALISDMLGRTDGLMSRAVIGVTITLALCMVFGGFQERPNFAHLVFAAFCAWPIFLLIAKAVRPSISWYSIWVSVPIMSWFLVVLMLGLSDGAPFSGALGILLGWIYMVIPFGILSAIFVGIQRFLKRIRRGEQDETQQPPPAALSEKSGVVSTFNSRPDARSRW